MQMVLVTSRQLAGTSARLKSAQVNSEKLSL